MLFSLLTQASIDVVASVNRQHSRSGLSLGQRSVSDSDLVGLESAAALLEDQLLDQGTVSRREGGLIVGAEFGSGAG